MPGPGRRAAAGRRMKGLAGGRREKLPGAPKAQASHDFTCAQDGENEAEFLPDDFEEKPEREKKHTNFTLCNVCNIQLNSAAQAQIHYNGKSHQKRLKQLSNGMLKNDNSGTCQSPALPALVRPPAPPLQPSLDIKPFLPFPLDTAAAVNLFPNFNAMDPIQKAVINHTFGVPLPHRRKQIISCNICQLRFNSDSQAAAHYKGTKHAKKLKALEAMKNKQKSVTAKDSAKTTFTSITTNTINTSSDKTDSAAGTPAIPTTTVEIRKSGVMTAELTSKVEKSPTAATGNSSCPSTETEEEKAKRLLYCSLCKVAVNSASQLEAHNSGEMSEFSSVSTILHVSASEWIRSFAAGDNGVAGNWQLLHAIHHISSRRHKDRAAGKPPKPKYSPYNKLQKAAHPLGVKLVFSKEPTKPLAPRILPNPLAAAAAAAAVAVNSPFSLRTAPAATLFQTSALPPALLRPAPGPIRTAHTPVLFAPY
ncbi:zinc finger protein 385D [Suricata suricatta]|uniref:zinc finger protein 385D n=1 Tax=Suricata suricatta TaxID=37032 RepID=UPI0011553E03|nr:zinc finger protein 385D [Suricata suricatta]